MESKLCEGPFSFMDLLDATRRGGQRFRIAGDDVRHLCFACDATFDQTDEGWQALRAHEGEHGCGMVADLSEMNGRTLRIVTWKRTTEHSPTWKTEHFEIWGVDDERDVVYSLSNAYQRDSVWKWRFRRGSSGALAFLNAATPNGQD